MLVATTARPAVVAASSESEWGPSLYLSIPG